MYISSEHLPHAELDPLPLYAVHIEGGFWRQWQDLNQDTTLQHGYAMLEQSGALPNMRIAAGRAKGEFRGYVFQDSDLYKWLEGAALSLGQHPDPALEAQVEAIAELLAAAQAADGYLDSYFVVAKPGERWTDLEWAHEMYCAGHLIEAGIAYKRATAKPTSLTLRAALPTTLTPRLVRANARACAGIPKSSWRWSSCTAKPMTGAISSRLSIS